jgi:two-component system sensor histidine kinase UhpB
LRPSALDDLGLIAAVRWYAATHLAPLGIQVDFDAPAELPPLPALVQTAAFRVMQEALANVAKHAAAHHVIVRVRIEGGALHASIADDGHGFDPETLRAAVAAEANGSTPDAITSGRGLGVLGMQERISLLGGHLALRSAPRSGTTVAFALPIDSAERDGSPASTVEPQLAHEEVAA